MASVTATKPFLVRFGQVGLAVLLNVLAEPATSMAQAALPEWVRSAEVQRVGTPVYRGVEAEAARRGSLQRGTRVAVLSRVSAARCDGGYAVRIAEGAYVCEELVRFSDQPPAGQPQPQVQEDSLLPFDYAFVRIDGTRTYRQPADYGSEDFVEALGRGFGVVVTGYAVHDGIEFAHTRRGFWIDAAALGHARGSAFSGASAAGGVLNMVWTRRPTRIAVRPGGRATRRAARRERLTLLQQDEGEGSRPQQQRWLALAGGGFVRAADVLRPQRTPTPAEVGPNERWLDVDVATQILVAYRGATPMFATLVSTGRHTRGPLSTPLGTHRLWVKLATGDMANLERSDVRRNYAIEGVPWIQYFEGSNGLHAAFWHDDFGRRRSHGCVNLAPQDAAFLFQFTEPALPDGWLAVFPTEDDPGTIVRVRDSTLLNSRP